jgi:hypothetical protein
VADVRDIVTDALRELGVLAQSETASGDDATSGLSALNRLVDSWAAERLMIYTVARTSCAIATSDGEYTVGTGANFDVARPVYVDHLTYSDSASPGEIHLEALTDDGWAAIEDKTETSTVPGYYYYNPTFPTATLSLWPVPTSSTLTAYLYAPQQVAEFASLSTAISLPPGWRRALVKNLAVEMAPSYEKPINPLLLQQAAEAKGTVKRSNKRLSDMRIECAALGYGGGDYDIYTGV